MHKVAALLNRVAYAPKPPADDDAQAKAAWRTVRGRIWRLRLGVWLWARPPDAPTDDQ
jgi:hypothetical protein